MSKKYSRSQGIISRESDSSLREDSWLNEFKKNLDKTAVQSKRVDDSLFDQINSIMNGKSKYTSVSAAVEDMMQRSGLTSYLSNVKKSEKNDEDSLKTKSASNKDFLKKAINAAENNDWFAVGKYLGTYDREKNSIIPAHQSIAKIKEWYDSSLNDFSIPENMWLSYAAGYSEGAKVSDDVKNKDFEKIQQILSFMQDKTANYKLNIKKTANLVQALTNITESTKGNMPIIAIVFKLKDIFKNHNIPDNFWESKKLHEIISKLNLKEKSKNNKDDNDSFSIGKLESFDVDSNDSNTDAFHSLMPATKNQ